MAFIYFVGTYKPIMCGIADYTGCITRESPPKKWKVISFNLESYENLLTKSNGMPAGQVWYGIPSRNKFSASAVLKGVEQLGGEDRNAVLWFQHEFGIWRGPQKFITMLKDLDLPKIVSFHSLHFQSAVTSSGLRKKEYKLLQALLHHVEAITVFSHGVQQAVNLAFPDCQKKVHEIKHGIRLYPEVTCLNREEARKRLSNFLLESDLDQVTKEDLHRQRIFLDPNVVIIGQTGFIGSSKHGELLYIVRDRLQQMLPRKKIIAVRIGGLRDSTQKTYAKKLRRELDGINKFLLETWLPEKMLPIAQRAFDVNFYWPKDCTQSGILAHALGAGAVIAGKDLEGVGETLKEAGALVDTDLRRLLIKVKDVILNPELSKKIEERALKYAAKFSWKNQARRHYELAAEVSALHHFRFSHRHYISKFNLGLKQKSPVSHN